jgi:hypothetical protein
MSIVMSLVLLYVIFNVSLYIIVERICALLSTKAAIRAYKCCWLQLVSTYYAVVRGTK